MCKHITTLDGKGGTHYTTVVVNASLTSAFQNALPLVANSWISYPGKHCVLQSKKDWVFPRVGIKERLNDMNDSSRYLEGFETDNIFQ